MERIILNAREGYILTDGNTYGTTIYLAIGKSKEDFKEISVAEYEKMLENDSMV